MPPERAAFFYAMSDNLIINEGSKCPWKRGAT
jgi:hypothetical protein